MVYTVKRYFSYRLKSLESYFKTKKKQYEIAKAYKTEKKVPSFALTRPVLIKAGFVTGGICLIILCVIFSGTIIQNANSFKKVFQSTIKSASVKKKKSETVAGGEKKARTTMQNVETTMKKDTIVPPVMQETLTQSRLHNRALPFSKEMRFCVLANKANKTMYVMRKENVRWSLFRKYFMAIGEQDGRKLQSGDKKTPEGLYYIIGRKEKSELSRMYGPLAFVLNYPNAEDRRKGRSGNGIWIHGTNPDSTPVQTRGCLELSNKDIRELGNYIQTGIGTPVLIINNKDITNPVTFPDYEKIQDERRAILSHYKFQRDFFITHLEQWKNAWESRNIEKYTRYYHTEKFFGQGMEWNAWKERKSRTFDLYNTIEISIDKFFLAEISESTAVLKFLQGYASDRLNVVNGKKLDLIKVSGKWKIYRENSLPNEELLL